MEVSFTPHPIQLGNIHCTGGWVVPRAGLKAVTKRQSYAPAGKRNLAILP